MNINELSTEDLLRLKDEMDEEVQRRQDSRRDEFFSLVEQLKELAKSLGFSKSFIFRAVIGHPTESDLDPSLSKRGRKKKDADLQIDLDDTTETQS